LQSSIILGQKKYKQICKDGVEPDPEYFNKSSSSQRTDENHVVNNN